MLTVTLLRYVMKHVSLLGGRSERDGSADVGIVHVRDVKHLEKRLFVFGVFFVRVRTV